jgi:hypothetical protein
MKFSHQLLFSRVLLFISLASCLVAFAQKDNYRAAISAAADNIEQKVIAWRHDIHQNPELGNREVRTSALWPNTLQSLGMEVKTNVGRNRCGRNIKRR